jgi:hypothetical protein
MVRRILCLLAVMAAAAGADTVLLKNGEKLEGKAELLEDGSVRLALSGGGSVTLAGDQYEDVTFGPTTRELYEKKRQAAARADDEGAADHYLLGRWCEAVGLKREAEEEFREALRIDPGHEGARLALGHVREGDGWLSPEEYHRRRGEVRFEGRWVKKETKERLLAERAARKTRIRLLRLIDRAAGRPPSSLEARAALKAEPPGEVVPALIEALDRSVKTQTFAARELGSHRLEGKTKLAAVTALADAVVTGGTKELREAGIAALKGIKWSETPIFFCRHLYQGDRLQRIYALQALLHFPDVRAIEHVLASFALSWQGSKSAQVLSEVNAQYVQGYELVSGGVGPNLVTVALPRVSGIVVGSSVGAPPGDNSEDRRRKAEAYLRFRVLEQLTGEPFGTDLPAWQGWWQREGRGAVAAQRAAARAKAKKERGELAPAQQGPPPPLPD